MEAVTRGRRAARVVYTPALQPYWEHDQRGRLVASATSPSGTVAAPVAPGGFTVVTR
jgi:hypothetical protein